MDLISVWAPEAWLIRNYTYGIPPWPFRNALLPVRASFGNVVVVSFEDKWSSSDSSSVSQRSLGPSFFQVSGQCRGVCMGETRLLREAGPALNAPRTGTRAAWGPAFSHRWVINAGPECLEVEPGNLHLTSCPEFRPLAMLTVCCLPSVVLSPRVCTVGVSRDPALVQPRREWTEALALCATVGCGQSGGGDPVKAAVAAQAERQGLGSGRRSRGGRSWPRVCDPKVRFIGRRWWDLGCEGKKEDSS